MGGVPGSDQSSQLEMKNFLIFTGFLILLPSGLHGKTVPSLEALMEAEEDLTSQQLGLMQTLKRISTGLSNSGSAANRGVGSILDTSPSAEVEPKGSAANRGVGSIQDTSPSDEIEPKDDLVSEEDETDGMNTLTPISVGKKKLVFKIPLDGDQNQVYKFNVRDLVEKHIQK